MCKLRRITSDKALNLIYYLLTRNNMGPCRELVNLASPIVCRWIRNEAIK